jgi:threonine/homoserine/homoserine lactone efflux protein
MITMLVLLPSFAAFSIAALALAITPGPVVTYLLTETLSRRRRTGFASLRGVALGNLGNAVLAIPLESVRAGCFGMASEWRS